jgi:hypothetical protein
MPDPILNGKPLEQGAQDVLIQILNAASISSCTVTSVGRTVEDQARVMFDNCESQGVAEQKGLYKAVGDKVIDVYDRYHATMPREAVEALMTSKILEVGASNVSHHIIDAVHWVFDVAPSSIPAEKQEAFIAAAATHPKVSKLLKPPADPAYHLEVSKPSQNTDS